MRKAIRITLIAVAAIFIGSAMARGLPHHAAAPAPPPSSGSSGGSLFWDKIFPIVVLIALGWAALAYYHRRKTHELHLREAKLDGFVNVRRSELGDLWRCPECHALILLADIDDHQEESACAAYQRWLAESDAAEGELEAPGWAASQVADHTAATLPPEHSVTTGGYDSIEG